MRKKMVAALVVLIAGALTLPTHEALAFGGGGFGGGPAGALAEASTVVLWDAVSTAMISAEAVTAK